MKVKIKRLRQVVEAFGTMKQTYLTIYEILSHIRDDVKGKVELKDVVNYIHVIRQISKYADDLRKEADGVAHVLENIACAVYITQNNKEPIRAALATGTPDVKIAVTLPKRRQEPEKYKALLSFFGVDSEAVDSGVVKAYWPGICERVSQLAEEGKPFPPGIDPDKTYSKYSIRIRATQDLDELLEKLDNARIDAQKDMQEQALRKEEEACNELLTKRPTKNDK